QTALPYGDDVLRVLRIVIPLEKDVVQPRPENRRGDHPNHHVEEQIAVQPVPFSLPNGQEQPDQRRRPDNDSIPVKIYWTQGQCNRNDILCKLTMSRTSMMRSTTPVLFTLYPRSQQKSMRTSPINPYKALPLALSK